MNYAVLTPIVAVICLLIGSGVALAVKWGTTLAIQVSNKEKIDLMLVKLDITYKEISDIKEAISKQAQSLVDVSKRVERLENTLNGKGAR